MRLDQYVSQALGLSRKQAQYLVRAGEIRVDEVTVSKPNSQVACESLVEYQRKRLSLPQAIYIMLHKPAGYVCANHDSTNPTVLDLIDNPTLRHHPDGLQIAGRLDKDTTGLVLITTDGQWNHKITSPKKNCFKTYQVTLTEALTPAQITQLEQGIALHGEKELTRPSQVQKISDNVVNLSIQEGKYHQVKRMFTAVGNHVAALHRFRIGEIVLDAKLAEGQYRLLTEKEINSALTL